MPVARLRRLRKNEGVRELLSSTQIFAKNLLMPYFVIAGKNKQEPITALPGIKRLSIDLLLRDIQEAKQLGIKGILLFGISKKKDAFGSDAYSPNGIVAQAISRIKQEIKDTVVISDVCLCGYTTHGHCGIVKPHDELMIDNDRTLAILAKVALAHAAAGADFVAPSAMMDGQVKVIREALDRKGFLNTGILAYAAKYASNFYGPFREAQGSTPKFGDRKTYQLDYRNAEAALREIEVDIQEGADIIMVKPALAYLDIIRRAKEKFNLPLAAYNVSGEYSLVKAAAEKNWVDGKGIILEILTSIKRAGADLIITYHAKEVARWLKD